ncbi:hypothetical protein MNBD_ACTINO02-3183, partial [hydrothermal vent metagenome]
AVPYAVGDRWDLIAERFHIRHHERNGFSRPSDAIEVVTVRCETVGRPAMTWDDIPAAAPSGEPVRGSRKVLAASGETSARVYRRSALVPGTVVTGAAIIEEEEATTYVDTDDRLEVLDDGSLELTW